MADLPPDAVIAIQSFMEPLDIISLRQCSKALQAATMHRTVWLDALRRLCARHSIPTSTYPVDKMSLPDLIHAATAPARFISAIRAVWRTAAASGGVMQPFSTRLFTPRLARQQNAAPLNIVHLRLVPGGRYLFTAASTGVVCLWDLGYGPASLITPAPVATVTLPTQPVSFLIQATPNQSGARLVVSYPDVVQIVTVFEINLNAAKPKFTKIAEQRVHDVLALVIFALSPDRITFYADLNITVWDFIRDTAATIDHWEGVANITVTPTTMVVLDEDGQHVFDIPPLHPVGSPLDVPVEPSESFGRMTLEHITKQFPVLTDVISPQEDWLLSHDGPDVLDIVGERLDLPEGDSGFSRCIMHPIPDSGGLLPRSIPAHVGSGSFLPGQLVMHAARLQHAQNAARDIVFALATAATIAVNVASLPSPSAASPAALCASSATAILYEFASAEIEFDYDLDALSGRLVVLVGREMRVVDYLVPNA
uniref:F-box domain-containing protein n=1 Tax=Mycena chlorophos TaxID=658473 RepID=A0ABQ0LGF2_MYCCL|nr:predicted protein [Mycena chlorophos]